MKSCSSRSVAKRQKISALSHRQVTVATVDWIPFPESSHCGGLSQPVEKRGHAPDEVMDFRGFLGSTEPVPVFQQAVQRVSAMRSLRYCIAVATVMAIASANEAAEPATVEFYRGINLYGPALEIDGHHWDGNDAADMTCDGKGFENQQVPLKPATDPARAQMIRSSRWGREITIEISRIPAGDYQVCLYIWEDNDSTTFSVFVQDKKVLDQYRSGTAGSWKRLGPFPAYPKDGVIRLSAKGGDANLSGIEIWKGTGDVPSVIAPSFATTLTDEQLAFFESKIRPVLIERCYSCHSLGAKEVGGNLLVDSRSGLIQGGDNGPPIFPGDPESSLLVRAIRHTDPDLKMPPDARLSDFEIANIEQWIRWRAPDPRTDDTIGKYKSRTSIDWDHARDFWSLKPLIPPSVPATSDKRWPSGDLDRFVLAKIEAAGLSASAEANKSVLLRRVTMDLTGLLPTLEEQLAFESDTSPQAWERVVDRLLESPRYGERWGRHWLDVVRYSDTAGDNSDYPIPQMYLYRDWVINAFNRDLPYDQFVREQLAGDLIGGTTPDEARQRLIATGYLANSRRFGSRVNDYPWHLTIEDTLDNLGRTFLGTTINCARCHNHKFDPVTTEDYYALYGIFRSTRYPWPGIELEQFQRDLVPLIPAEEAQSIVANRNRKQEELDSKVRELEKQRNAAQGDERKALDKQVTEARQEAERHQKEPLSFPQAYAVAEAAKIEDAAIQIKGDPEKPGPIVPRRFLTVLNGVRVSDRDKTSGRLQLANWIVDPANPLTARVMANRIWLFHFAKSLVPTPNDFGRQGKPPIHPELLGYLATRLIKAGWSIKAMHREILLSKTYRISSERNERANSVDPTNDLFSTYPRHRLDAESIRDALLQVGGQLDLSRPGPHPFPPQSAWKFTQHNPFKAVYETRYRSVYLMTQRIQRHPYLAIFDGADPAASTPSRPTSTTPLQALFLLNDAFVHEQAIGLAQRLISERSEPASRIELAYRLLFSRSPTADEAEAALGFLQEVQGPLSVSGVPADQLELQSWQSLARALFRLNEFVYLD
jgi:hypothetical protein